jgi:hypothetical protein
MDRSGKSKGGGGGVERVAKNGTTTRPWHARRTDLRDALCRKSRGVTKLRPPTSIQFARLLDAWKRVLPSLDAPDPEGRIFHLNFDVDWLGLLLIPFRPDLIIEMEKRFLPA